MIVARLGGVFDAYRRTASTRTAIALVAANAIPLIGVLFFGWSLLTILVVYWVENGIVGLWNVPKILLAQGSVVPTRPGMPPSVAAALSAGRLPGPGRAGLAAFFLVHYGIFWLGHGFFVLNLPAFPSFGARVLEPCLDTGVFPTFPGAATSCAAPGPFGSVVGSSVVFAAIALFLSHGASFAVNYLGRREYVNASPPVQMFAPYGRVVVLHLTIIFGAFIAAFIGAPIGALIVLVVLKTAFDLRLHLREHPEAPAAPS